MTGKPGLAHIHTTQAIEAESHHTHAHRYADPATKTFENI